MKTLVLLVCVLIAHFTISAQPIEGTYTNKWESPNGEAIAYSLALQDDGTFNFQLTRTYLDGVSKDTLNAGGTWNLEGLLLTLKSSDNSNKMSSDLNMNKARYISISSRNPDFNSVHPSLKFYESAVFYAKDMELIKINSKNSSSKMMSPKQN